MIQPSFCRSSGPILRLRSVLSEISNSNQVEFFRVCIDPFETTQALFLKRSWSTVTLPSFCLILTPRNQCIFPLSSMWNVASSAFLTSEITVSLSDATMKSSTQTKTKVWPSVSSLANKQWSFLLLVNHCLSRKFASFLYQLLAACFKPWIVWFSRHTNFSPSDPCFTNSCGCSSYTFPLLVSAGKPSWHQIGASRGPASLIVDPFARYDFLVCGWSHWLPSLVVLECLDFVLHFPVPLVPIITLLGFIDCFGFHIVILGHSKMVLTSPKNCRTFIAGVPRRGSALSAWSSASSKKPTVSDYENSSMSLSSHLFLLPRHPRHLASVSFFECSRSQRHVNPPLLLTMIWVPHPQLMWPLI